MLRRFHTCGSAVDPNNRGTVSILAQERSDRLGEAEILQERAARTGIHWVSPVFMISSLLAGRSGCMPPLLLFLAQWKSSEKYDATTVVPAVSYPWSYQRIGIE